VIEDNPADVELIEEALTDHNVVCDLTIIGDGEKAIQLMDALDAQAVRCPDLVLLDLKLPKREGSEVLVRMRASTRCSHIPVIILTSSDEASDRAATEKLGVTKYIQKPNRLEEFVKLGAVFKDVLEKRKSQ
jgi:DNA-binding response OmpR family regulator